MGFFRGLVSKVTSAVKSIFSAAKSAVSAAEKAITTGKASDVKDAIDKIDNTINQVNKLLEMLEKPKKPKITTGAEDSGIFPTWDEVKGFFQRKENEISDYIVKGRNYLEGVIIAGSKDLFMDPGIDVFSAANRMLESVGLTPKGSTNKFYSEAKSFEKKAEDVFVDKYVSDKKSFYKGAYDADKASAVLGAYQAAVGLGEVKAGITTMEASEPLIAADGVGAIPEVAGAAIAIKGAVDSAWGGSISYNSIQNQNIDFAKMEEAGSSGKGVSNAERIYQPSPKHDPASGWGSPDPIPDIKTGQEVLDTAYSSSKTKQLYNYYDGKLVKFQPDTVNGWHSYEVVNPAKEVPADVLRQMLNDGKITKVQYKNFIKNK